MNEVVTEKVMTTEHAVKKVIEEAMSKGTVEEPARHLDSTADRVLADFHRRNPDARGRPPGFDVNAHEEGRCNDAYPPVSFLAMRIDIDDFAHCYAPTAAGSSHSRRSADNRTGIKSLSFVR